MHQVLKGASVFTARYIFDHPLPSIVLPEQDKEGMMGKVPDMAKGGSSCYNKQNLAATPLHSSPHAVAGTKMEPKPGQKTGYYFWSPV